MLLSVPRFNPLRLPLPPPAIRYAKDTSCTCSTCSRPHELECWGYNGYGQTDVPKGQFRHVVADLDFTCAIYAECNGKVMMCMCVCVCV